MASINEQARASVYVDGDQAGKELQSLEKLADQYRKKLAEANKAGDLDSYKKHKKQLNQVNKEIKQVKKESFDTSKVLKNLDNVSMNDLKKAQRQLRKETERLNRNTEEYANKSKQLEKVNNEIKKTKKQMYGARKASNKLKDSFSQLLPALGVTAIVAGIGKITKNMFNLAKTMQSENRRANIVFGESLRSVQEEVAKYADQLGVTDRKATALAASTGDMLKPIGFAEDKAADMSTKALKLAGALDEWTAGQYGVEGSLEAINSAITGEMEQLKKFGIVIRQNDDEFLELKETLMETKNVTEQQAKAMATMQLIQEKSLDAQASFNREGNKLLRLQKNVKRQWQQMKEGVVNYFEVSTEEKLRRESNQVDRLAMKLTDANTKEDERRKILKKLEGISPQIVEGLDAENVEYDKLNKNIQKYNENVTNKILLEQLDEKEKEIAAEQADIRSQRLDEYNKIVQQLKKVYPELITQEGTLNEKVKKANELLNKKLGINKESGDLQVDRNMRNSKELAISHKLNDAHQKYKNLKEEEKKLDKEIAPLKQKRAQLLEMLNQKKEKSNELDEVKEEPQQTGAGAEEVSEYQKAVKKLRELQHQWEMEQKSAKEREIQRVKDKYAKIIEEFQGHKEKLKEAKRLQNEEIEGIEKEFEERREEEAYNDLIGRLDKQHQKKINSLKQTAMETKMTEKELNEELEYQQLAHLQAKKEAMEKHGKDVTQIEGQIVDKQMALRKKETQQAKEDIQQKKQLYKDLTTEVGQSLGKMLVKEEKDFQAFTNNMLLTLLDFLKKYMRAKIAHATIGSLATPESIATAGAAGVAKAAILTGLMEAAFAAAKATIKTSGSGSGSGSGGDDYEAGHRYTTPQNASGKYDVVGAADGRTYKGVSYTGTAQTGMYEQPTLVGERGPEMVLSAAHTRNIKMNYPELLDAIMATKVPQRAEGKYDQKTDTTNTQTAKANQTTDALIGVLNELSANIQNIRAYITYDQLSEADQEMSEIEEEQRL